MNFFFSQKSEAILRNIIMELWTTSIVTDQLKAISVEEFKQCFQKWENRIRRCVTSQGNYFEVNDIYFWLNDI